MSDTFSADCEIGLGWLLIIAGEGIWDAFKAGATLEVNRAFSSDVVLCGRSGEAARVVWACFERCGGPEECDDDCHGDCWVHFLSE